MASLAVVAALVSMLLARRLPANYLYAVGIGATAAVMTVLMRGHHGGFINVFMFLHWTLALGMVVVARDLVQQAGKTTGTAIAAVLMTLQLGHTALDFDLSDRIPDADDVAAGDAIVAYLAEAEGPILSPFNPWLAAQAGHEPGYHLIALWDIRHPEGPFQANAKDLMRAVSSREYGTVVMATDGAGFPLGKHYDKVRTFQTRTRHLFPKAGWRRRPNTVWVPKP